MDIVGNTVTIATEYSVRRKKDCAMNSENPGFNSDSSSDPTRLRAGDRAREAAARGLQRAFDEGQLDYGELQERSAKALRARYQDELTSLFLDLDLKGLPHASDSRFLPVLIDGPKASRPQAFPPPQQMPFPPAQANKNFVNHQHAAMPMRYAPQGSGSTWSLALFGGAQKKGPWICARQHTTFAAFGGIDLDFTQAQITSPRTTIEVVCLFGGVDIAVPENFRVEINVLPIFGGAELKDHPAVSISQSNLPADAPTIVINGMCAFGGVDVKRVPRSI